jgi:orotate phosphoribosyltransferase
MGATASDNSKVIDFLIESQALKFGEFTLKSGRKAPYFINTGSFDDGEKISRLSRFYAEKIMTLGLSSVDLVFGPAYKGIPLCVSTAMSLARDFNVAMPFCFNRKEAKTHGDGGAFVGKALKPGMRVVLVEDVVTAGTTLQEMVPILRDQVGVEVAGVVILVDRDERGKGELSAVREAEVELGIAVHPIVNISEIISYLAKPNSSGLILNPEQLKRIEEYRAEYGAVKR